MRTIAVVLVLGMGLPAFGEPVTLGVMSFNIRYGTANDGDNSWMDRRELVAETIRRYEPAIIGTQETLPFQAEYLETALEGYRRFGMGRDAGDTGERMEVLYREDVLTPLRIGHFWLSESPDVPASRSWNAACNRMVTWAQFYHDATGQTFYFYNTHFDHRSKKARRNSARLLFQRVQSVTENAPIVVTGDFNAKAEASVPWSTLTSGRLADAWLRAETRKGPPVTWSGFEAPREDADRRIDWILVGGPVKVLECQTVTFNQANRYPSDHFPVFARLTLFQE